MKCETCNGTGFTPIGANEIICKDCAGTGLRILAKAGQDATTPFNEGNTKPVPDAPGLWYYHATGLPAIVIEKEGELYFTGADNTDEEMEVSEFARIKASHPHLSKYSFTKISNQLEPINLKN